MYHSLSAAVPCPNCGEHTLDIIESRPSGESRRRRKLCRSCGHRLGTREVSEAWYAQALSDRALLERIRADLAPLSSAAAPAAAAELSGAAADGDPASTASTASRPHATSASPSSAPPRRTAAPLSR